MICKHNGKAPMCDKCYATKVWVLNPDARGQMTSNYHPIPKVELREMVKHFTLDQLFEISQQAFLDATITKEQLQKEIDELEV